MGTSKGDDNELECYLGHCALRRQQLGLIVLLSTISCLGPLFAHQLYKGARLYQLNHLQVSQTYFIHQELHRSQLSLNTLERSFRKIHDQSTSCTTLLSPIDRALMATINTDFMFELCQRSIRISDQALTLLRNHPASRNSEAQLRNKLKAKVETFLANSFLIDPLVTKSIYYLYRFIMVVGLMFSAALVLLGARLLRSMSLHYELLRDLHNHAKELKASHSAETSLRKKLIHEIPCLLVGMSADGQISFINQKTQEVTGYNEEELINRNWWKKLYPGTHYKQVEELFSKGRFGRNSVFQMELVRRDGEYRQIEWRGLTHKSSPSKELLFVGMGIDLTDKINVLKNLNEAKELAEAANLSKSEFLANMSHEIRTPLNGVLGNLELLEDFLTDEEPRHHVQVARESANSLMKIIDDILDIAKVEAGRITLEVIPFDISHLTKNVISLYTPRALRNGVRLYADLPEEFCVFRLGDPTRLRQILNNLVSNAIKFTPSGEICISLLEKKTNQISFEVRDSGIGIHPHKLNSIFDSFEQADTSTTRKYGGTGLGLSLSQKLAQLMGGHIEVSSKIDKGSTFSFELELPRTSDPLTEYECPDATLMDDDHIQPSTVLLADDNRTNIMVAKKMLERLGHEVLVATDGQEVIDIFSSEKARVDLVLMDIQMPNMDGVEATRYLHKTYGSDEIAPIIALTAHAMRGDRAKYLAEGMCDYMTKPVTKADLKSMVAKWTNRTQQTVLDTSENPFDMRLQLKGKNQTTTDEP